MFGDSITNSRIQDALDTWRLWSSSRPFLSRELPGGLTNLSFLIETSDKKFVLRINAKNSGELGIDRQLEIQALSRASEIKIAPTVIHYDIGLGFLVTEYVDGRIWNHNDVSLPQNTVRLAKLLKAIHGLDAIDGSFSVKEKISLYKRTISIELLGLQKIDRTIDRIVSSVEATVCDDCLCHNDLLASNIVERSDGDLCVLDWEYAAMGHPFFDLAAVIDGQVFDEAAADCLVSSYLCTSLDSGSDERNVFWQWRVIYCYIDLLWFAVQPTSEKKFLSEKTHHLDRLLRSQEFS
jgi:thiamine kinase